MKLVLDLRDKIRREIADRIQQESDKLCRGQASDFAGYKRAVGRIEGLRDASEAVTAAFKQLLNEEESDE